MHVIFHKLLAAILFAVVANVFAGVLAGSDWSASPMLACFFFGLSAAIATALVWDASNKSELNIGEGALQGLLISLLSFPVLTILDISYAYLVGEIRPATEGITNAMLYFNALFYCVHICISRNFRLDGSNLRSGYRGVSRFSAQS